MGVHTSRKPIRGLLLSLDMNNSKSYSGSGSIWKDLSGRGNNLSLINEPAVSGGPQKSLSLDGVDTYIEANTNLSITSYPFSVVCWVKFNSSTTNNVFGLSNSSVSDKHTGFGVIGNGTILNTYMWNYSDTYSFRTGTVVNTDKWYNFTVVYVSNTEKKFYLNGSLNFTWTNTESLPSGIDKVSIGRSSKQSSGIPMDGDISYFNIYERELSSSEVIEIYDKTKLRYLDEIVEVPRIVYQRPTIGQVFATRRDGSEYWQYQNGYLPYPEDPENPTLIQRPAENNDYDNRYQPTVLLKYNNIFGNKYRFTNTAGNPGTSMNKDYTHPMFHWVNDWEGAIKGYVIDHLTGLAFTAYAVNPPNGNRTTNTFSYGGLTYTRALYDWESAVNYAHGWSGETQFNLGGFTDWRLPTVHEGMSWLPTINGTQTGYAWDAPSSAFDFESLQYWYETLGNTGNPPRGGSVTIWLSSFWSNTFPLYRGNADMRGNSVTAYIPIVFVRNHF